MKDMSPVRKIEWNESLILGIPEVDEEHRQFILLANDLIDAVRDQTPKQRIERLIGLVVLEVWSHFEHEERLLRQYGYAQAKDHGDMHTQLMSQIVRVMEEFYKTDSSPVWIDKALMIEQLLVDHLLHEDMKFRPFLQPLLRPSAGDDSTVSPS